jgi:hypothetical protein
MRRSEKEASPESFQRSLKGQWRFLDLFRTASTHMLILTGIMVAAAWVPLVTL